MCSVERCDRPARCRGLCSAHYKRLQVHGDVRAHIPLTHPRSDLGGRRGPKKPHLLDPDKRPCRDCKQVKPLSEFGPLKTGPLGRKYACRACEASKGRRVRATASAEQRQRMIAIGKRSYVKGRYGAPGLLALERIDRGEPCDVCGNRPTGKRAMAIDHCHTKGHVRGILCKDCNLVLGWMNDDPKRLRALADYLDRQR